MIPQSLGSTLRRLAEPAVQPLAAVQPLPSDAPLLEAGERFRARMEAQLAGGNWRAQVGGRSLVIDLQGQRAEAGEMLELAVVERRPGVVLARPADSADATLARLSATGRLIGSLLEAAGEGATAALARGGPLLEQPPSDGHRLAAALRQAVAESGLFYEAHLARWSVGEYPLESLLREPQARRVGGAIPGSPEPVGQGLPDAAKLPVSPELAPIVARQLEAAAGGELALQAQVWPGQWVEAAVVPPDEGTPADASDEGQGAAWSARLRLHLPALGEVEARLQLGPDGLALRLAGEQSVQALLAGGGSSLAQALGGSGVHLLALTVTGHDDDPHALLPPEVAGERPPRCAAPRGA
ncbi:MAG: flagellar hook-length control protein FliK [Betaproteobacteria bacterium]|nr:flagellar hook-length control protein FliK [Betaproteobacteria bacterium]